MFQLPNYTVSNQQTTAKVRSLPEEDSISWDRYPSFDYTDDLLTTVATRLPESRFTSCHVNRSFSFVRNEAKWRRRREVDDFMREMKFHKQLVHRNQARGRFRSSCVPKRTRREAGKQRKRGKAKERSEQRTRRVISPQMGCKGPPHLENTNLISLGTPETEPEARKVYNQRAQRTLRLVAADYRTTGSTVRHEKVEPEARVLKERTMKRSESLMVVVRRIVDIARLFFFLFLFLSAQAFRSVFGNECWTLLPARATSPCSANNIPQLII